MVSLVVFLVLECHDEAVANILAGVPIAAVIHQVGILTRFGGVFEGTIPARHLAKADHVRLAHQNENLHRLGHVRRLAIRIRHLIRDGFAPNLSHLETLASLRIAARLLEDLA